LVYYKGFEYLIQAMKDIDATLIIVGDGPEYTRLEDCAWQAGVRSRVVFAGWVRDLRPYYHAASVFVLPSIARSEAFGLVQLEAMAAGKPVVNTALMSGVPFVSQDGLTGITVPPCDPEALSAALNRLLGDAALRESYGRA